MQARIIPTAVAADQDRTILIIMAPDDRMLFGLRGLLPLAVRRGNAGLDLISGQGFILRVDQEAERDLRIAPRLEIVFADADGLHAFPLQPRITWSDMLRIPALSPDGPDRAG